jgi:pyruvate dehydrogenase E2 component (dihydrolipoamide acetyltransferase)
MSTFRLPDLGEGLQEAEIVTWHVAEGDHVVADQPLLSVETAKAVVEIPSPRSGRIAELHGTVGDIVAIGAALVDFADDGEADTGAIVGDLPSAAGATTGGVRAAPAVRALAARLGVNLAAVTGSGPGGAVTSADVEKAASGGGATVEPLRGVRRAMMQNMARAGAQVVPATVMDEAIIEAWPATADVTIKLARAIAAGAAAEPALNAWYDGERQEVRRHRTVDLGIAMDTPDGLFVPALRDVGSRSDDDLRRGLEAMKRDVVARKVPAAELTGQTISLSNFGMIAGRHTALVVVPPQVAILGAGRIVPAPRVIDGEVRVCRVLPLSLTFDHRVVSGGEAARFLAAVIAALEASD